MKVTEQLRQEARAYYALVDEAERASVPTDLEDPRSPRTVEGLRVATVDALRRKELARPRQYRAGIAARRRRLEKGL